MSLDHREGARAASDPWGIGFGIAAVALAVIALLVWFPNDIRGGFTELSPGGDIAPGDAFFPTLLTLGILTLGMLQVAVALRTRSKPSEGRIERCNILFLAGFLAVFFIGIGVMQAAGPLLVALMDAGSYRALSDTVPWKYVGFVFGALIVGLAPLLAVERRLRLKPALVVLAAIVVLILVFDVLLADIRLPPNANV